jgi:hypothetical protein
VTGFRFSKGNQPVYLVWSDAGSQTVDFSTQLSGQVSITDATGQQSTKDAVQLLLTEEPLFVEPLR